jgi:hypothetical protein
MEAVVYEVRPKLLLELVNSVAVMAAIAVAGRRIRQ